MLFQVGAVAKEADGEGVLAIHGVPDESDETGCGFAWRRQRLIYMKPGVRYGMLIAQDAETGSFPICALFARVDEWRKRRSEVDGTGRMADGKGQMSVYAFVAHCNRFLTFLNCLNYRTRVELHAFKSAEE